MLPLETLASGASATCDACGVTVRLEVLRSPAGWYIGTRCRCGPYTREPPYYQLPDDAAQALVRILAGEKTDLRT